MADSFLSGMGLMRIISTGNYWRKVSCPAWGNWIHLNRKLLANSFLSGMRLWCIISTGNDWRKVSCPTWGLWCINSAGNYWRKVSRPTWGYGASSQQETISEQFPVRHVSSGIHLNRKLLANSFLSGMGLMRIISTGNYWRKVSCPACEQWEPTQQETICRPFPVRHGAMFTISIGNYWRTVSCPACEQWEPSQQETIGGMWNRN